MHKPIRIIGVAILSTPLYLILLYFTPRSDFIQLWLLWGGLFTGYFYYLSKLMTPSAFVALKASSIQEPQSQDLIWILSLGIIFRLIALGNLPNLSDDFYRFVWDGRLMAQGINPFLEVPSTYIQDPTLAQQLGLTQTLYDSLNSPEYFTIYPPLNQFIFWISAVGFPDNLYHQTLLMKGIVLLAEIGTLLILPRILAIQSAPTSWTAIYALNPLVIVELTGNLHFEAFMIFFLLSSIYALSQHRWIIAVVSFSLSVASKLLPLMFLPLLIRRMGFLQATLFAAGVIGINLLLFLPIMDRATFFHIFDSVELYFQSFEFNASFYYIIRWVGYQIRGYNVIQIVGKYLAIIVFLGVWLITYFERRPNWNNLPAAVLAALTLYFAMASIVHPWYITTLVALSGLTHFRYPIVWSALLPLTYFTYRDTSYEENLWLVALEYTLVWGWLLYEILQNGGKRRN